MQIQTHRFECRFELEIISLHILIFYYCTFEFIRIGLDILCTMYFTVCSMLTMYFKMVVQHFSVENVRCYIVGFLFKHLVLQFCERTPKLNVMIGFW